MQSFINGEGYLAIFNRWVNLDCCCVMIVVYAPQELAKKKSLWQDLSNVINNSNIVLIVLGDFNEVRSASERLAPYFVKKGQTISIVLS